MTRIIINGVIRALGWVILFSLTAKIWPRLRRLIEEYRRLDRNGSFTSARFAGQGLTRGEYICRAVLSIALDTAIIIALIFVLIVK